MKQKSFFQKSIKTTIIIIKVIDIIMLKAIPNDPVLGHDDTFKSSRETFETGDTPSSFRARQEMKTEAY